MANIELRKKWRAIVDEWADSELTAIRWAKEHGVNAKQLYYWIAKFKEEDALSAAHTRWLQLETGESPVSVGAFEVRVCDATVVVKPGFDPEVFAGIVRILRQC